MGRDTYIHTYSYPKHIFCRNAKKLQERLVTLRLSSPKREVVGRKYVVAPDLAIVFNYLMINRDAVAKFRIRLNTQFF